MGIHCQEYQHLVRLSLLQTQSLLCECGFQCRMSCNDPWRRSATASKRNWKTCRQTSPPWCTGPFAWNAEPNGIPTLPKSKIPSRDKYFPKRRLLSKSFYRINAVFEEFEQKIDNNNPKLIWMKNIYLLDRRQTENNLLRRSVKKMVSSKETGTVQMMFLERRLSKKHTHILLASKAPWGRRKNCSCRVSNRFGMTDRRLWTADTCATHEELGPYCGLLLKRRCSGQLGLY